MGWTDSLSNILNAVGDLDGSGDRIVGGPGDSEITGTDHSDEILADPVPSDSQGGDDTVFALGGDDTVFGFGGDNFIDGGPGDDELVTADGDDEIHGGAGQDEIQSGRGTDIIHGGPVNDELRGGEGDDLIHGDQGDDRVIGSSDDDELHGGLGRDLLEGRDGIDTFVWTNINEGGDTIADFTPAIDRLQLATVVAGFDGSEALLPQFVRIVPTAGHQDGLLQVDADGPAVGSGWRA